jgi:choline dehydrogenase
MHFQSEDGKRDVEDLREAIKRSRKIMSSMPVSFHVDQEIFPGPQADTDEDLDDHIYKNVFGTLFTSSCILS